MEEDRRVDPKVISGLIKTMIGNGHDPDESGQSMTSLTETEADSVAGFVTLKLTQASGQGRNIIAAGKSLLRQGRLK